MSKLCAEMLRNVNSTEDALAEAQKEQTLFGAMAELRLTVDELETFTDKKRWPYPTYAAIFSSIN
jgi:glutamine synthetase type III